MNKLIVYFFLLLPLLTACIGSDNSGSGTGTPTTAGSGALEGAGPDTAVSPPIDSSGKLGVAGLDTGDYQAGTLTAGDYDDQLNADLFQEYLNNFFQAIGESEDIPKIELQHRIAIKVTDSNGNAYGGAQIKVVSGGNTLQLVTPSSGIVYIYEGLDDLADKLQLTVTDKLSIVSVTETITMADIPSNSVLDVFLPAINQAVSELDLMLVIDTTGSMGDELDYLKAELSAILDSIQENNAHININVGLVAYRDNGDEYVVRDFPFINDIATMQLQLNEQNAYGGGDYPEAMDQAIDTALSHQWREKSLKVMLLVADAPPHDENIIATWQSALQARSSQIHIVPVAASGVATKAEFLMRSMAAVTHSRYLFLTDDSGVGSPHEEPDINCYIVTRLDNLIARVLNSLITGIRAEPNPDEIIRTKGNYNSGVCQPPAEQSQE